MPPKKTLHDREKELQSLLTTAAGLVRLAHSLAGFGALRLAGATLAQGLDDLLRSLLAALAGCIDGGRGPRLSSTRNSSF